MKKVLNRGSLLNWRSDSRIYAIICITWYTKRFVRRKVFIISALPGKAFLPCINFTKLKIDYPNTIFS